MTRQIDSSYTIPKNAFHSLHELSLAGPGKPRQHQRRLCGITPWLLVIDVWRRDNTTDAVRLFIDNLCAKAGGL